MPGTKSATEFLSAGTYKIMASGPSSASNRVRVKIETASLKTNNTEPNNSFAQAMTIRTGQTIAGGITENDEYDFYKIKLQAGYSTIKLQYGSQKRVRLYNSEFEEQENYNIWSYSATEELPQTYTITTPNLKAGTYYVVVYAGETGKYRLKVTAFDGDLSKASITLSTTSYTYNGYKKEPYVTVTKNGNTLRSGTDYTVSYKNNVNAGTAYVYVKGIGKYSGTGTAAFKITGEDMRYYSFRLSDSEYTENGKARKPVVTSSSLTAGKDYTVSYKNNVHAGQATVIIKGKGNYTGTTTKTFIIKPKKATLRSVKSSAKGKLTASWKKDSYVSGYEIWYCSSSSYYGRTVTVNSKNTTSKTITGLSRGTQYKVQVRSFKKIGSRYYYGEWSSVKRVKVK